jgi:hypothetical protein
MCVIEKSVLVMLFIEKHLSTTHNHHENKMDYYTTKHHHAVHEFELNLIVVYLCFHNPVGVSEVAWHVHSLQG